MSQKFQNRIQVRPWSCKVSADSRSLVDLETPHRFTASMFALICGRGGRTHRCCLRFRLDREEGSGSVTAGIGLPGRAPKTCT